MKLAKDQIARQFSRAASTYDLAAQLQNEMATHLIESIPSSASGNLVDLGCGTGWALSKLAQMNRFGLTAVDIAPGMVEVARARVPSANFYCCDLEETPLDSNMADIVFSNAVLQWCDINDAVREMRRICKTNGSIVFSTFGPNTLREIRSAWQMVGDQSNRIHEFESCQAIESAMQRVGYRKTSVVRVERKLDYDSVDALLLNIKQMGATNASKSRQTGLMGARRYREFREVFERQMNCDGRLELTFECIFVLAENV